MSNTFLAVPNNVVYYRNLHKADTIRALQYRYKGKALIYAIRCQVNGMMYIGSTMAPALRFHSHLVTGTNSNTNLQEALGKHGLNRFTVYVLEVVSIPKGLSTVDATAFLTKIEQGYMDRYPRVQLYNTNKSSA